MIGIMMPKTLYIFNVTMSLDIIGFKMLMPAPTVKKRDHLKVFSKSSLTIRLLRKLIYLSFSINSQNSSSKYTYSFRYSHCGIYFGESIRIQIF